MIAHPLVGVGKKTNLSSLKGFSKAIIKARRESGVEGGGVGGWVIGSVVHNSD